MGTQSPTVDGVKATSARGSGQSSSQLIAKVAALIEFLASEGASTAAEVSTAIDEPRSSVYRLLRYLADVGWIIPGKRAGSWELSVQLFRLGSRAVNRLDFTRVVRPYLSRSCTRSQGRPSICAS